MLDEIVSISDHDTARTTWDEDEVAALALALSMITRKFVHIGSSAVDG